MSAQLLRGALDEARHLPALFFGIGLVLDDLYAIACFVLIFRVMSLVALPNAYILFVHGVHFVADHLDHHGLVHLVALDATDEPPARNPLATAGVFRGFSAHALPPSFWLGCCLAAKA